jgi:mannose-6-phosphate isomerase-like protein (cupin superfamily)
MVFPKMPVGGREAAEVPAQTPPVNRQGLADGSGITNRRWARFLWKSGILEKRTEKPLRGPSSISPRRPPPNAMDVVNHRDTVPFTTVDGSTIRELLAHRNSAIRQQSLAEARLAPGCATVPHHHAVTEEIYYILTGTAAMTMGGHADAETSDAETRDVGPGDAIAIPPGIRHTIRNTGDTELVFLCTCAPGYEHTDTFLDPPPSAS